MPKAPSLKSLIPRLAQTLGITPAALYERQRSLVRADILKPRPGRGPGSGVPGDGKSVAMLLISLLATGSLSEVEKQTKAIASLKCRDGLCPMTGKRTFGAALVAALESELLSSKLFVARATRSGERATALITFFTIPVDEALAKSEGFGPSFNAITKYAKHVWFGADPHDLDSAGSALDVEATIIMRAIVKKLGDQVL